MFYIHFIFPGFSREYPFSTVLFNISCYIQQINVIKVSAIRLYYISKLQQQQYALASHNLTVRCYGGLLWATTKLAVTPTTHIHKMIF
jgi:hypothetical protein